MRSEPSVSAVASVSGAASRASNASAPPAPAVSLSGEGVWLIALTAQGRRLELQWPVTLLVLAQHAAQDRQQPFGRKRCQDYAVGEIDAHRRTIGDVPGLIGAEEQVD